MEISWKWERFLKDYLLLHSQRTLNMEYLDGDNKVSKLATWIAKMRDPKLFIPLMWTILII